MMKCSYLLPKSPARLITYKRAGGTTARPLEMAVSFRYWDDCVEPEDLEAMWRDPEVSKEWIDAGENKGQKVHLSRDPDGQPYLTQTEMKTVAMIIVSRHFSSLIDPDMICAIATLESDRQLLTMRYNKKIKDTTVGIMQLLPKTAEWLVSDMGYRTYEINGEPELLYRPFISVYFGAAYLQWLSNHDGKERNEEYVVRAYRAGPKKATHKSTLDCWQRYLSVKQSLPSRRQMFENHPPDLDASPSEHVAQKTGDAGKYWDSRASPEDMDELWKNAGILKEWIKTGERRGKVRFSRDESDKPYLSRLEVKAVAGIIISKHFNGSGIKPVSTYSTVKNHRPLGLQNQSLSALAEISSMRFLDGAGSCTGIMGLDYEKACWLYKELGYTAYKVKSIEDLSNPFISMYFAAAYMVWLSKYEGRERSQQFVIQAYLNGPEKVNLQETGPLWLKFEEALSHYDEQKTREHKRSSCSIL